MVLSDQSGDFTDQPPSNEADPYQSTIFDFAGSSLPRPIPIVGPLLGFGQAGLIRFVNQRLVQCSELVHRPLHQDEATAVAHSAAKFYSRISYGYGLGTFAGLYRCWATRKQWKYPFRKVRDLAAQEGEVRVMQFSSVGGIAPSMARIVLHLTRAVPYVMIGYFTGGALMTSFALVSAAASEFQDGRLIEVNRARGLAEEKVRKEMDEARRKARGGMPQNDDSSRADEEEQSRLALPADPGDNSDRLLSGQDMNAPSPGASTSAWGTERPDQDQVYGSNRSRPSYDDASPTGGFGPLDSPSPANAEPASAWERIRRQSSGQPSQSPTSSNPQQSRGVPRPLGRAQSGSDSFSYSSADEERQLAKDEAQKEFDARLERERRGGDFNEGQTGSESTGRRRRRW